MTHEVGTFGFVAARCDLWEKGFELFKEMDEARVQKDVVTYNSVLDAVSSQIVLGRNLFKEGIDKGFYSQVSKIGRTSCELALHFLSLGGGEIACKEPFGLFWVAVGSPARVANILVVYLSQVDGGLRNVCNLFSTIRPSLMPSKHSRL